MLLSDAPALGHPYMPAEKTSSRPVTLTYKGRPVSTRFASAKGALNRIRLEEQCGTYTEPGEWEIHTEGAPSIRPFAS
jgi:hypothetical protein